MELLISLHGQICLGFPGRSEHSVSPALRAHHTHTREVGLIHVTDASKQAFAKQVPNPTHSSTRLCPSQQGQVLSSVTCLERFRIHFPTSLVGHSVLASPQVVLFLRLPHAITKHHNHNILALTILHQLWTHREDLFTYSTAVYQPTFQHLAAVCGTRAGNKSRSHINFGGEPFPCRRQQ